MLRPITQRHLLRSSAFITRTSTPARQIQSSSRCLSEDKADTAFDPQQTKPEEQNDRAAQATAQDSGINATEGANPAHEKSNRPRPSQEGGSQGSQREEGGGGIQRDGQSGGGSPNKAGGGSSGSGGGSA
ncbi:hypothetical protein LTR09_008205 [Extremus antarcticus]|uniref:Uncharacterized protein n=1 Tax=Extremus antarcticus TaxID=702011 RepID=A0AAJ0DHU7_9PEZI|nr:hypothetical protein LTR09_008205 [Extremus antarcticus]